MISLRARLIRYVSRQYFRRITPDRDVRELRARWNAIAARVPRVRGVTVRSTEIDGIPCDWLVPHSHEGAPLLYYLHGGAFLMGSPLTHRHLVSHIARECGVRALLPDYRLAPEYPFPAALKDALRVYRALRRDGQPPVVIGGDSAGGNLAAATMLSLRDGGEAMPQAAVLLSPWLDLAGNGESMRSRRRRDPWFRPADMPAIAARYSPPAQFDQPLVSPVHADLSGLPPTLLQVGDDEILRSDAVRFAEQIGAAGGNATLEVWSDMWHVFQYFVGRMPESLRAIRGIAAFLEPLTRPSAARRHRAA